MCKAGRESGSNHNKEGILGPVKLNPAEGLVNELQEQMKVKRWYLDRCVCPLPTRK